MSNMEPLNGNVFVFTGEMKIPREEAQSKVVVLGGRFTTSVSSKTTYLVTGSNPGDSKVAKAKQLKTEIIGEEEFLNLIAKYEKREDISIDTNIHKGPGSSVESRDIDVNQSSEINDYTLSSEMKVEQENLNIQSWVEKYRPKTRNEFVGNPLALDQLDEFFKGKTEQKAALLSGSPGVGKTTAAHMLCKANGYEILEFNASDLRSKGSLSEYIAPFTKSLSLGKDLNVKKRVIIMDEVDGMTSDRGGIPELINIIKNSKSKFVCICNDASHIKMRTLANNCLDIRFRKLDSRSILPKIKSILEVENKTLPDGIINELIINGNGDMRYVLNTIQNIVSNETVNLRKITQNLVKKNVAKNTFEMVAEIFQNKSVSEKIDIFFEDYNMMPLFIHENYIKSGISGPKNLFAAADSISYSNLQDAKIHGSDQEWSLLPYFAFFSSVYPTKGLKQTSRIDFTSYLGQSSKTTKHLRFLNEFVFHCNKKMSRSDLRLYCAEIIYKKFSKSILEGKIDNCVSLLLEYNISKEDISNLEEVLHMDLFKKAAAKNKSSLTRECKKIKLTLPSLPNQEEEED